MQITENNEYRTEFVIPTTISELKKFDFNDSSFGIDADERTALQNEPNTVRLVIEQLFDAENGKFTTEQRLEVFEGRGGYYGRGIANPCWYDFNVGLDGKLKPHHERFDPFWAIDGLLTDEEKQIVERHEREWENMLSEYLAMGETDEETE